MESDAPGGYRLSSGELVYVSFAEGGDVAKMLRGAPDVGNSKIVPCARRKVPGRRKVAEAARVLLGADGDLYVVRYRYFWRRRPGTIFDYDPEKQEFAIAYQGSSLEEAADAMKLCLEDLDGSGFNFLSLESLGGGHVAPRQTGLLYSAEELARGLDDLRPRQSYR